ncbi:hypothetical protein TNCV_984561 [Trichonephila clavipes]|nr:hypothetical protein TNCV_984561 [Trichonephila clavipes]
MALGGSLPQINLGVQGCERKKRCPRSRDFDKRVLVWNRLEESPGWRELEESVNGKGLGPRLEWKGRKDDERPGGVGA